MIFTAFIDESNTHGPSPDMVMSAILGSSRQWEVFLRRLSHLQLDYGFNILHGTEFKNRKGEFSKWPAEKGRQLLLELGVLVRDHLTEGVTVSLAHEVYKDNFLRSLPPKMHRTSQYGLCFLGTLDVLERIVTGQRGNHRLSVVVEAGHKNVSDTARLFRDRAAAYSTNGVKTLHAHSIAFKKQCGPLMVADIMAYGSVLAARSKEMRGRSPAEVREPRYRETGWTTAEIGPPYVKALIEEHLSERRRKHAAYIRRKERASE